MNQRDYDIRTLNLKIVNKNLSNEELTHFKIFQMYPDMSRNDFVKDLRNSTDMSFNQFYYCMPEYINNFIFVLVWSGRASCLETMAMISNYSNHKLKDVRKISEGSVMLIFKKSNICKNWLNK